MAEFSLPVRIVTGDGSLAQVGKLTAGLGRRVLVICGKSAVAAGVLAQTQAYLDQAGMQTAVFTIPKGEPTLATVEAGLASARAHNADIIVGLGGGSPLDVAKSIAGLLPLPGSVAEYFGGRVVDGAALPWVAIPTTSGTGAEVTMNAVLIDEATCSKKSIRSEKWYASVAIIDPVLNLTAPPSVTAHSGADALCQAIESFVSLGAMPVTDALAREAIRMIGHSLLPAYRDGQNLAARRDMAYGSLMAGMALANARLGAVHGMAHPLGCRYQLAHGLICGLLLPYVMRWNMPVCGERYAEVAALMGADVRGQSAETAANIAVTTVEQLLGNIGIPKTLSQAGAAEIDWPGVAHESMSGSMKANPRPMSEADVIDLLREAF